MRSRRLRALLTLLLSSWSIALGLGVGCVTEPTDRGGIFGDRPRPSDGTDAGDAAEDGEADGADAGEDGGIDAEVEDAGEDVGEVPEEDAGR